MHSSSAHPRPLSLLLATLAGLMAVAAMSGWASGSPPDLTAVGDESWDGRFFLPGVDAPVNALTGDGAGNVFVGGEFGIAGDVASRGIARWDGADWHNLGGGVNGDVAAVATHGGTLYAGGSFTVAGGSAASNIAAWDGSAWAALGGGVNGRVEAIAIDDDGKVFAGGAFTQAGGLSASRIAVWDGAAWREVGSGANGTVRALVAAADGTLYAAGAFTTAGGVAASRVAAWNGSAWRGLDRGLNNTVVALAVADGTLYAGGHFTFAGGVRNAHFLAAWDGTRWGAVGGADSGVRSFVNALAVDGLGRLFVGGSFSIGDTGGLRSVIRWDGTSWTTLGEGLDETIQALAVDSGGHLYAGGAFSAASEAVTRHVATWDGTAWRGIEAGAGIGDFELPDTSAIHVGAMAFDSSGRLVVAGAFTSAGTRLAQRVAAWDGARWHALGAQLRRTDSAAAVAADTGGNIYVGGTFSSIGGVPAQNVARWDGNAWRALGSGMNRGVSSLTVDTSGDLFAAGAFDTAGGVPAAHVARWNGTSWSALGAGWLGASVVVAGPAGGVYACCNTNYEIGRWDGSTWSVVGGPLDDLALALAVDGGGTLYAGGLFNSAGGVAANHIAQWAGSGWSALGSGVDGPVNALAIGSDGAIFAGGAFGTAGGATANRIAQWNGATWNTLGSGVDDEVRALVAAPGGDVYVGGRFETAGEHASHRIARWVPDGWIRYTATPTSTSTRTLTPVPPTSTPTVSPSASPTTTPVPPTPTRTVTLTPAPTLTPSVTPTPSITVTPTPSLTPTPTSTSTASPTSTPPPTATLTPTPTPTAFPDSDGRWDERIGAVGIDDPVSAIAADGRGNVYVGGLFSAAGGVAANNVAWWSGDAWHAMGTGISAPVNALVVDAVGHVYAGGEFTLAGGLPVRNLAVWDGFSWSPVGGGVGAEVKALSIGPDGSLYAAGAFDTAGSGDAEHVAVFNGQAWRPLGNGLADPVEALAVDRFSNVYAATRSSDSEGGVNYHVWRWDGTSWTEIHVSAAAINAIAVGVDGRVFIGGSFSGGIKDWDGQTWAQLGTGLSGAVTALVVDGRGYVFAAGRFSTAGSVRLNRVARWDGRGWNPLGSGLDASAFAIGADAAGIYVGGDFATAGGKTSVRVGWYHAGTGGAVTPPPTGTAGATPTPTIPGSCHTLLINASDGGTVESLTPPDCGTAYTTGTVVRLRAVPSPGHRWLAWTGDATGRSVITNVVMTSRRTVGARFTDSADRRRAVLLVHEGSTRPDAPASDCPPGGQPVRVDQALIAGGMLRRDDIEQFARLLYLEGQETWIGRYDSAPDTSDLLIAGAACVRAQLRYLGGIGVEDVAVVAHDTGGMVARAYLESDAYIADRRDGRAPDLAELITLGTAHGGVDALHLGCNLDDTTGKRWPGLCSGIGGDARTFNNRAYSRRAASATYGLIGGTSSPRLLWLLPRQSLIDHHDGVTGVAGATGRARVPLWPQFRRLETTEIVSANSGALVERHGVDASHFSPPDWRDPDRRWYPSYFNTTGPSDPARTETYQCVLQLLGLATTGCAPAPAMFADVAQSQMRAAQVAPPPSSGVLYAFGHVGPGETLTRTVNLNTAGPAQVGMAWVTGTLAITLTNPVGIVINPTYAALHPGEVRYVGPGTVPDAGLFAGYFLNLAIAGQHIVTVSGVGVPPGGSNLVLSAVVSTEPTLVVGTDRAVYPVGSTAVISAGLAADDAGLTGADVEARITLPGGGEQVLAMSDGGDGTYTANFAVPPAGAGLPVRVTAAGEHESTRFTRLALTTLFAEGTSVDVSGPFDDTPLDDDEDGLYDRLQVTAGMTSTVAGEFVVSADLVDDEGNVVAHTVETHTLAVGGQTLDLSFDGDTLREAGRDGPYRLTNLTIVDPVGGFDPILTSEAVLHTTGGHAATDFAATCYVLDLRTEPPEGGIIATAPTAGCNLGLQHPAGTTVALAAQPAPGFAFVDWSGAVSGSTPTGAVDMAQDLSVTARFVRVATETAIASATPTITPTPPATNTPAASPTPSRTPAQPTATPPHPTAPTATTVPEVTPTQGPPPRPPGPIYLPVAYRP